MPALFGSLLVPVTYNLLLQLKLNRWISAMGGLLIILGEIALSTRMKIAQLNNSNSLLGDFR